MYHSLLENIEAQLWEKVDEINRESGMSDAYVNANLPPIVYKNTADEKPTMSAIDRLKEKALAARSVAPDAIKDFEADLDSILAEKAVLAQKREEAVAPHKEAIAGIKGEFDGLKSAIDILSNG